MVATVAFVVFVINTAREGAVQLHHLVLEASRFTFVADDCPRLSFSGHVFDAL